MSIQTNEMISINDPNFLQIPLLSFNKNKQDIDIDQSKTKNLYKDDNNIENDNSINYKKLSSQDRELQKLRNYISLKSHGQSQKGVTLFSPNEILKLKYYFSEIDPTNDKIIENKFQTEISIFIQRIPVFNATSKFMILWKLYQTIIIAFYFVEIPIYLSWGNVYIMTIFSENLITTIKYLSFSLLVADIFLEFITSFYLNGNLVTIKSKIARKYLRSNFSYDLIAASSFFIVYIIKPIINYQFMIIFFYFKIKWLLKFNKQVEEMLLLKPTLSAIWGVFKIIVFMFQCIIIFACCFYSIGIYAIKNNQNSWLLNSGNFGIILNKSPHEQLYFSFYFSLALFTTVMGYGDITPLNKYECSFCLFGIIFAVLVFALNFNKIELLIENYDQLQKSKLNSQISMQYFFKTKEIQPQISEQVRQYLNQQIYSEKYRDKNIEQAIIQELAPVLKEELLFAAYGIIFQNQPLFNDFSQNLLSVLSSLVQEIFYSQEAILFQENIQDDNQSFYYIFVGQILLYPNFKNGSDQEQQQIKKLRNGDSFGEWAFMTGLGRKATAKTHTFSILYEIKRNDFINTLGRFQNDFELFHQQKECLIFGYQNLVNLNNKCWTCESTEHYAMDCPKSRYLPQIETIIQEQGINSQQERIKYERSNRIIWRTLQKSQSLIKTCKGRTNRSNNIIYELKMISNNSQNQFKNEDKKDKIQQIRQELQKQFERQSIVDFDKLYQFKNYFPESNIANYWTTDGTLKMNNEYKN